MTARSKTDSIRTANSYASTRRAIMSAKRAARSISSGVKGGYGGSPGRFTNSSTPMVSFLVLKGVASSVTVLKPVFLSAWDQNDPSSLTSFTAIGCPLEKTRPAIPFPGGMRIFNNSSSNSLTATRNFSPPSLPSRINTDASADPTECAATPRRSSTARLSGSDNECDTSIALMASRIAAECASSPAAVP